MHMHSTYITKYASGQHISAGTVPDGTENSHDEKLFWHTNAHQSRGQLAGLLPFTCI